MTGPGEGGEAVVIYGSSHPPHYYLDRSIRPSMHSVSVEIVVHHGSSNICVANNTA